MRAIGVGLAALIAVWATLFLDTGHALADNGPHVAGQSVTTDSCAGCHRAHTAKSPDLLKVPETQLCYSCHDGTGATTNVLKGASTGGGALKAGGFQQASINTQDPTWSRPDPYLGTVYGGGATSASTLTIGVLTSPQPVTSAHSVDGSLQTVWGNGSPGSGRVRGCRPR